MIKTKKNRTKHLTLKEASFSREETIRLQHQVIMSLTTDENVIKGDIEKAFPLISEASARLLDVPRVGIWLMNWESKQLICHDIYDQNQKSHQSGLSLQISDYPNYFKSLGAHLAIDAVDASNDPRTCEFKNTYLMEHDIHSMLDAPVRIEGKVVGVICHENCGEKRQWTADDITIVGEIAGQVANVLINRERHKADFALKTIVEGTVSKMGESFFCALADKMAEALTVRTAIVTQALDNDVTRVRTLAFWDQGKVMPNIEYDLKGTPCEIVLTKGSYCCSNHVQDVFPEDKDLGNLNAVSFLGVPFFDKKGKALGHIAVLDEKPLKEDRKIISILEICAARVGLELERLQAAKTLQKAHDQLDQRVKERTLDLENEVQQRIGIEKELKDFQKELKKQQRVLEQKNLALKEVLDQIEFEKNQIKQDIISNVEEMLLPLLNKMKRKSHGEDAQTLKLLEQHLKNLTSGFALKISDKRWKLTPKEIEICDMIKNRMSSKDIAGLLNVSTRTVEIHRNHIRKKLGISQKSVNLTTYLQSI
ncbi:MAG: GAF domain-containing protein [Candidatus Omnitrophica bacterium]|nr:GAF domain-containing protein [Candidatus Omnitrophota bacterium]